MDEANKLVQELRDRKKELKAVIFNDDFASFFAFPSTSEASLGELVFIQLPFEQIDFASSELKPVGIRPAYDFLLSLEHGERIIAFKELHKRVNEDHFECFTIMTCFDRLGQSKSNDTLEYNVQQANVVQCGPSEFVVRHEPAHGSSKLSVYNSNLTCLRDVVCKSFSNICCNSEFVFGLWNSDDDDDDNDNDNDNDDNELDKRYSRQRIRVHHLDTLSEAFDLRVPNKYTVERILADEHHLVAVCSVGDKEDQWYMSVFDLATCSQIDGGDERRFSLPEENIDLEMERLLLDEVFLLDGWLVVPTDQQFAWFDGKPGE